MGIASQVAVYMVYPNFLFFWTLCVLYALFVNNDSKKYVCW